MWHALGDRVGRVNGPHDFAVLLRAPAQGAGGAHELAEDLGPVPGVQHQQAHSGQDVLVHALNNLVGDLCVRSVAPPDEDVGGGENLLGQTMVGIVKGHGADLDTGAQVFFDPFLDGVVHAVRVEVPDFLFNLFVPVFSPHNNFDGGFGAGQSSHFFVFLYMVVQGTWGGCRRLVLRGYFTAPPVAPAAMYFCATTSRTMAGSEDNTAVAITALQFETWVPRYW